MSTAKQPIRIIVKAPVELVDAAGSVTVPGSVPTASRDAYLAALAREVESAAGDAAGGKVIELVWDGCSPANMTLAAWCHLVELFQARFPEVNTARMLFSVPPELVNQKTVAYAFRFRSCFEVRLPALDEAALAALDRARVCMEGERFSTWGVSVARAALGGEDEARARVERLASVGAEFVHVTDAPGAESAEEAWAQILAGAGFKQVAPGLYACSPKYVPWFSQAEGTAEMGFGLGAASCYAGTSFRVTSDADAYIAGAGLTMDIYEELA